MLVTLGQNFQSKYEKKLKPKNHLLFAKANESSFFLHSLVHIYTEISATACH